MLVGMLTITTTPQNANFDKMLIASSFTWRPITPWTRLLALTSRRSMIKRATEIEDMPQLASEPVALYFLSAGGDTVWNLRLEPLEQWHIEFLRVASNPRW